MQLRDADEMKFVKFALLVLGTFIFIQLSSWFYPYFVFVLFMAFTLSAFAVTLCQSLFISFVFESVIITNI
jgi:hypothetical protein